MIPSYTATSQQIDNLLDKLVIPASLRQELNAGALGFISISGGKDSDAMLELLPRLYKHEGWREPHLLHCDTGRSEWYYTPGYIERRALETGLPLHVVRRWQGDLLQRYQQNLERNPDQVPFPSTKARFCTSELKTAVTDSEITTLLPYEHRPTHRQAAIVYMGIRAQESPQRAKKGTHRIRPGPTTVNDSRTVYNSHPLFHFTLQDVWQTLGLTLEELHDLQIQAAIAIKAGAALADIQTALAFPYHVAYLLGNSRLSCSLCFMASDGDIRRGIEHNPEFYIELVRIETQSGFAFRQDYWLGDIRPDLLPPDLLEAYQRMRAEPRRIPKPSGKRQHPKNHSTQLQLFDDCN